MDVIVKHAFIARGEGELSGKEGERLLLVEQSTTGWWKMRNREGLSGWIPSTYLDKIEANLTSLDEKDNPDKAEICIAVHRFSATHADEISFKVGDSIEVMQKKEDGWWKGRVHGLDWTGWFPADHVEPKKKPRRKKKVQREESSASKSSSWSQSSEVVTDSDADSTCLKRGAESHSHLSSESLPATTEQKLKVLYSHAAGDEDELSIAENDILYLVRRDESDLTAQQGWWQVMNSEGRTGLVPANYVEFVSSSDTSFRAIALHDYNSVGGEEMSFVEGQILDVVHSDSEWWFVCDGETGNAGYAPSNYLRPLVKHGEFPSSNGEPKKSNSKDNCDRESLSSERRSMTNKVRSSRKIPVGPFSLKEWYFGPMSRKECEAIFAKSETCDGDYLVRDGGKHALDFVLSVKSSDRVRHFRITMGHGTFSLVPTMMHKSMDSLINHHKSTHLFTEADGLKLLLKRILGEEV